MRKLVLDKMTLSGSVSYNTPTATQRIIQHTDGGISEKQHKHNDLLF
jgi:hypothetical protein